MFEVDWNRMRGGFGECSLGVGGMINKGLGSRHLGHIGK